MSKAMQLKARIKNLASKNRVPAQAVLQNFMLERLLERISLSKYKDIAQVNLCEDIHGIVTILYKNKSLPYTIFQKPVRQSLVVNAKSLDQHLQISNSPAPNHPWRQYGTRLNGDPILVPLHHPLDPK
jgi:hypothetical protein